MMRLRSKAFEQNSEEFTAPCVIPDDWWSNLPFDWSNWRRLQNGQKVGHTITPLYPTESPLISEEPFYQKNAHCKASLYKILLYLFWILQEKPLSLIPWISCSRISGFRVRLHCAALLLSIKRIEESYTCHSDAGLFSEKQRVGGE